MKHRVAVLAAIVAAACTGTGTGELLMPRPPQIPVVLERVSTATPSAVVATEISPAPTVRVKDRNGNPVVGVVVAFSVALGSGTLMSYSPLTNPDGIASAGRWTLGTRSGKQIVTAHLGALPPVTFTAAALAGPVTEIADVAGNGQYGVAGAALRNTLSVRVTDEFVNPVAGVPVVFAVVAGDGSIAGDSATSDSAGIAVSGAWTLGPVGPQQVNARSGDKEARFEAVACEAITWGCAAYDEAAATLAFVRGRELYRVSLNGTPEVQLTSDAAGYNYAPAWSPDRSRIAFLRHDGHGGNALYILKAGGELTKLVSAVEADLTWSPDGRQLAYSAYERNVGNIVFLISADIDGTAPIRLTQGRSPAWSPDGTRLAFVSGGGIYAINADGTGLSRLIASDRWFDNLDWSPDGRSIAVTVYSNCDWDDDCDTSIEVLDVASSQFRMLVPGVRSRNYASGPAWSPDGRTIAFSQSGYAGGYSRSVSAVNVDGTGERVIIANGWSPSWRR